MKYLHPLSAVKVNPIKKDWSILYELINLTDFPILLIKRNLEVITFNTEFERVFKVLDVSNRQVQLGGLGISILKEEGFNRALNSVIDGAKGRIEVVIKNWRNNVYVDVFHVNIYKIIKNYEGEEIIIIKFQDVTEKTTTKSELKEQNRILQLIVDNTTAGIFVKNKQGRYLLFNKSSEIINELPKDDVIGKTDFQIFDPETAKKYVRSDKKVLKTGKSVEVEEIKMYGGKEHTHLVVKFPLRNFGREDVVICGISTDISERIKMEKRKDDFIDIASHELRIPVTVIKASAQMLEKRFSATGNIENNLYLKMILEQTGKMQNMINSLLNVSRIEAGKFELNKEEVDMKVSIENCVKSFQLANSSHRIHLDLNCEKCIVDADRLRIEQVMINLLSNAVKYSPQARIIEVRLYLDNNNAVVAVRDYGIGISAMQKIHLFEKFYRGMDRGIIKNIGLGLGLYISAELVKMHGGKIWVESVKGKGSTFYFSLPVKN
jgi:PAS domain S-box-containing protein